MTTSRTDLWDLVRQHEDLQLKLAGSVRQHGLIILDHAWHEHPHSIDAIYTETRALLTAMQTLIDNMSAYWSRVRQLARAAQSSADLHWADPHCHFEPAPAGEKSTARPTGEKT